MVHARRLLSIFSVFATVLVAAPTALAQCKSPVVSVQPMSGVVAPGGYLAGDGRGAYVDGSQGAMVNIGTNPVAANMVLGQGVPLNTKSRFLTFNLNTPIVESGAVPLGVIEDRQGELHVHYYLGPVESDGLRQVHSFEELPDDGVFYSSERTNVFVRINGVRHMLMFGGDTWNMNVCVPTNGVIFDAPGSTKLQVARQGNTYIIQAPPGTTARLYDYSNTFAPVDKGLYRFSFLLTLSPIVKKNGR
jgi:hypothetical protein